MNATTRSLYESHNIQGCPCASGTFEPVKSSNHTPALQMFMECGREQCLWEKQTPFQTY